MTQPLSPQLFERAAATIAASDALIIAAGAGLGIDSGLPDFRGNEGFWRAYPALGRSRLNFYDIASPAAFRSQPELAWGFYGHRLDLYRRTTPHAGFEILQRWGEPKPQGAFIFTSNVDGQFQKAGFDAQQIFECHGSIHHLQCLDVCSDRIWSADEFIPDVDIDACRLCNSLPLCPGCGGLARPNILMFGDGEWIERGAQMQAQKLELFLQRAQHPVIIEIGAGTAVPSVRLFGERTARQFDATLIRINPREADVSNKKDIALAGGALEVLEKIAEQMS